MAQNTNIVPAIVLLLPWVVGKLGVPVKNKNCQAYLMCSLFLHPLRCPVDLASSSSWLAQQVKWPK